jgi:DNA-binding NtrC family response regulator
MSIRILVVDDEPMVLSMVTDLLRNYGYDVLPASSPRQALEAVWNKRPIDVVLSDLTMPGMRGTDLVREIGQILPRTACILMTGGGCYPVDVPEGVYLIFKPVSASNLIAAIEEALAHCADGVLQH